MIRIKEDTKILPTPTQIMAPQFKYFHFALGDYNFCFKILLLRLKIVYALKCQHEQAMRLLVYQKQSLKVSVQSVSLNCVNSDKNFQIFLLFLKCIIQIVFSIVIAIPKSNIYMLHFRSRFAAANLGGSTAAIFPVLGKFVHGQCLLHSCCR